jgi:hypothetical protein
LEDQEQPRGKRAEDLVDELLGLSADVGADLRWDVRVFPQRQLVGFSEDMPVSEDEDNAADDDS